ncbi:hypothetical protein V5F77_05430 [Xanthobacter sp. DSM 24535]|uniref:hypothetical protein n=1 Tax=Roseixanthobacter psychrophilus TaxID=3119917 RepID=UPI0037273C56
MARGHRTNPSVNRYLEDEAMDHIDHALGRPVDPMGDTYRNHFVVGGVGAKAFAASPYWEEVHRGGTEMSSFRVTDAGRAALAAYLKTLPHQHKKWEVSFDGHTWISAAPTAAKAKYQEYLEVCDCCPDLTFGDFCRGTRVRRAA